MLVHTVIFVYYINININYKLHVGLYSVRIGAYVFIFGHMFNCECLVSKL